MKKFEPPKHLKAEARKLWQKLREDFVITDAAGIALLQVCCEAYQRAQEARQILDREGAILTDRFEQKKAHPACAVERDARAQQLAAIRALRLSPEE